MSPALDQYEFSTERLRAGLLSSPLPFSPPHPPLPSPPIPRALLASTSAPLSPPLALWFPSPALGARPRPHPGRHNTGSYGSGNAPSQGKCLRLLSWSFSKPRIAPSGKTSPHVHRARVDAARVSRINCYLQIPSGPHLLLANKQFLRLLRSWGIRRSLRQVTRHTTGHLRVLTQSHLHPGSRSDLPACVCWLPLKENLCWQRRSGIRLTNRGNHTAHLYASD